MNIRPIILDDILTNFARTIPFQGKDRLYIYRDKKEALKMFSMFSLGEYNKYYSTSITNALFSTYPISENVNVVDSDKDYPDLYHKEKRNAKIKFLWQGECSVSQREKIKEQFNKYTDNIYQEMLESLNDNNKLITKINGRNLLSNSEIEDDLSILAYQAMQFNNLNRQKRKRKEKTFLVLMILYITLISIILSLKLI